MIVGRMTRADSATLLARFSERLRDAGVAVSPDQTIRLATLVTLGVPRTVEELYWCARVSLLRSTADIAAFDAVFALVFRGMVDVAESRGDSTDIRLPPQRDYPLVDEEPRVCSAIHRTIGGVGKHRRQRHRPPNTDARKQGRETDRGRLRALDGGRARCAGPAAAHAVHQSTTAVIPAPSPASSW